MRFTSILLSLCSLSQASSIDASGVADMMKGVFTGAVNYTDMSAFADTGSDFYSCVEAEGDKIAPFIKLAVKHIKERTDESVPIGFKLLEAHFKKITIIIEECTEAGEEHTEYLEELKFKLDFMSYYDVWYEAEYLMFPDVVPEEMSINDVEILEEVDNAIECYDAENWEHFGEWIGDAIKMCYDSTDGEHLMALRNEFYMNMTTNTLNFTAGLIDGVLNVTVDQAVFGCIDNVNSTARDLMDGVMNLDRQTALSMFAAFKDFQSAFKDIIGQMSHCVELQLISAKLALIIEDMSQIESFVDKVSSKILINGFNVWELVKGACYAWLASDYHLTGYDIGRSINLIFVDPALNIS